MSINIPWPPLTRDRVLAEEAAAEVLHHLREPTPEALLAIRPWAWEQAAAGHVGALSLACLHISAAVCPPDCRRGRALPWLEKLALEVFVAAAVGRLRMACGRTPIPIWAKDVVRLLPVDGAAALRRPGSPWELQVRELLANEVAASSGFVYCLFGHAGSYIGKSLGQRLSGHHGLAARFGEHLRALLRPGSSEGMKGRYRILRRSLGSVGIIPIAHLPTEGRALAAESLLIRYAKPCGNQADLPKPSGRRQGPSLRPDRAQPRRRPPPHRRSQRSCITSVWSLQVFVCALARRTADHPSGIGASGAKGGFRALYTMFVKEAFSASGAHGPVHILRLDRLNLFLAYLATSGAQVVFHQSWTRPDIANLLYSAAQKTDKFFTARCTNLLVRKRITFLLRRHRLPPLWIQPLRIPPALFRNRPALRGIVHQALEKIRNAYAREWVSKHLRVERDRRRTWASHFNANRVLRDFRKTDFDLSNPVALAMAARMPSLSAVVGAWRLPVWPTPKRCTAELLTSWATWCGRHAIPVRSCRYGGHLFRRLPATREVPPPPALWGKAEHALRAAVRARDRVVVQDDKLPNKAWKVAPKDLFLKLLSDLLHDSRWTLRPDLTSTDVTAWSFARSLLGLPPFLRKGRTGRMSAPTLFAKVKSKCFDDAGKHVCCKPGHSCLRRILDFSKSPYPAGWRTLSRAVQGMVGNSGISHEVFKLHSARDALDTMVASLQVPGPGCCLRCRRNLGDSLQVVTMDIDQAFETIDTSLLLPRWGVISEAYSAKFGTDAIYVRKGRACAVCVSRSCSGTRWWRITADMCSRGLLAASLMTLAVLGDVVAEMSGVAIGGTMSSAAVSVALAGEEHVFEGNADLLREHGFHIGAGPLSLFISFRRYVDDIIAASRHYCGHCLEYAIRLCYSAPLSLVARSCSMPPGAPFEWVDLELRVHGQSLSITAKNPNRSWMYNTGHEKRGFGIMDWPGHLPQPFSTMRGVLIGKLCRAVSCKLGQEMAMVVILEHLLELHLHGYPFRLLRALVHALPNSPAAIAARTGIRMWGKLVFRAGGGCEEQ